jgi:nucleotide-binding universal stress UspA family protein
VHPGEPDVELMTIARVEEADLLVVGSRGEHSIPTALLGSVASTLMATAPCPVIITPPDTTEPLDAESMRGIVCGVAGDETDLTPLRIAADLAERLGGGLHAVHAYDEAPAGPGRSPDDELHGAAEQRLALALERAEVEARSTVCALPAAEALARIADRERAGLIVVGAGGGDGSGLQGSTPTRLAFDGRTALLVVPPAVRLDGGGRDELVPEAV